MGAKEQCGIEIAARTKSRRQGDQWFVLSQSQTNTKSADLRYVVKLFVSNFHCACPAHGLHQRDAQKKDYISYIPHYNPVFNYFANETLIPNLEMLVEESSLPPGDSLRIQTKITQINEAFCKNVRGNICCFIQSLFELNIKLEFLQAEGALYV